MERLHVESNWFTTAFNGDVDLNDPKTYNRYRYRNWTCTQLRNEIYKSVGFVKLYIEQFNTDWDKRQVEEVEKMLFWFGKEHRNYYQDTPEGRHWLRKWLFMFENETENMC